MSRSKRNARRSSRLSADVAPAGAGTFRTDPGAPLFEPLEQRLLLAAALADDGAGAVTYTGSNGADHAVTLTQIGGLTYQIVSDENIIVAGGAWTGSGTTTVTTAVGNVKTLAFTGGDQVDNVTVNGAYQPTTTITFNGAGGTDALLLVGTAVDDIFTVNGGTVQLNALPAITLSNTELLYLTGAGASTADQLNIVATAAGVVANFGVAVPTMTGGGMAAELRLAGIDTINLAAGSGTVTVNGTAPGNETVVVTPTGTTAATLQMNSVAPTLSITNSGALTVALGAAGADKLVVQGSANDDVFTLGVGTVQVNSLLAVAFSEAETVELVGGEPSASDVANLTGSGLAVVANLGGTAPTIVGGGLGTVNLNGIEVVNLAAGAGAVTVNGTATDDAAVVTPTGANTATVTVNAKSPTLNLT